MASFTEINASAKKKREIVEVLTPEWGGKTYLKALGAEDAGRPNKLAEKIRGMREGISEEAANLASWLVLCMCNKSGTRSLKDSQALCLIDGPLAPFNRAGYRCADINGLTEDLVGNSKAIPEDSSPSD